MLVTISGARVVLAPQSLRVRPSIAARNAISFTVQDYQGLARYVQGMPVVVYDDTGGPNLLSANQSNVETSTTGFQVINSGVTLTQDSAQAWQGTHALKCVCDGSTAFQGAEVNIPSSQYLVGGQYTASAWVFGTPGVTLVAFWDAFGVGNLGSGSVFTLVAGWQRIALTLTMPAGIPSSTNVGLKITTSGTQATTFWLDGLQVEQDVQASPWKVGGSLGGVVAAGVVLTSKRKVASSYSSMLLHVVTATDWRWLADKRLAATSYAYKSTGYMFRNLVDTVLAAEGVTYGRGVNLLSAQQSDVESTDMTPFTAIGPVTLSQDTTPANVHHGAGSLKVVTTAGSTFQGVEVRVTNTGANFPYGGSIVGSWWMKASAGTPTVRVFIQSSGGAVSPVVNVTLSTSWQKITICGEIPFPSSAANYSLRFDTGTPAQAITVWLDQLQMEIASATAWAPGGGVSNNLLTAEQADVEGATLGGAFTTVGGGTITLSQDTTVPAWSNAGVLKVVTDGTFAFQGPQLSIPNVGGLFPANGIVTFSFYAMCATSTNMYIASPGVGQSNFLPAFTPQWQRYQFTVQLPASPPNPILFQILTPTTEAATIWMDGFQVEVGAAPTPWELGGTQQTVFEGPEVASQVINYKQVATAFDDLATLAGYYWTIDTNKVAWFRDPATNVAPWTLDGTQAVDDTLELEDASPQYRNSQWMLGSLATTLPQTETQKGDGAKRAFLTSYPIHSAPSSITVNGGAAQTVGILGVDTGKQWYWNKGKNVLTQDASGTLLATTDTLSVTYVGEYVVVTNSVDSAQQMTEQGLEGAGTGLVEQATADTSLVTLQQAFQSGAALLSKFATPATTVTFLTNTPGLQPGQMLPINLPAPWGMAGVNALVESVQITYDDFQFWYAVTALVGPVNATWVQFFQAVASKQAIIDTTVASAQTIVNLALTETAAWNWSASYAATVTACPVFPLTLSPATLC